jgi:hypothetical protein
MLTLWIREEPGLLNPADMAKYNMALDLIRKAGATVGPIVELNHPTLRLVAAREITFDLDKLEELKNKVPKWARSLIGLG